MNHYSLERLIHFSGSTPDGIRAIYINTALRKFGLSLVGIFFPVFIFLETQKLFGESLTYGFYGVIAYFFLMQFVKFVITIPTAKFLNTYGFRKTIALSSVFLITLLILLMFAETYFVLLFVIALVHAFSTSFYWLSYHTLFAGDGLVDNLGKEVGVQKIIERISNISGPLLGGIIITIWGFQALFGVALVVVVISTIPFFFMGKHKHKEKVSWKVVSKWFGNKEHRNEIVGILGRQIDDKAVSLFLPLFAFLIVGTFAKQGLVESVSLVLGTISVYVAGKVFDKKRSRKIFEFGVISTSFFTLVRGFAQTFGQLLVLGGLRRIVSPFYWVNFDTLWYRKSRYDDESALMFAVINQIVAAFATFIVLAVALVFTGSEMRFWSLWILSVIGVIMASSLWRKGKKYE